MNITLAIILILLQWADAYTTMVVINRGGREVNPFQVWLSRYLPGRWTWLILTKAVYCVVIALIGQLQNVAITVTLVVLCAFYAWVVWHNIKQARK